MCFIVVTETADVQSLVAVEKLLFCHQDECDFCVK
jgi:hypothetical protein